MASGCIMGECPVCEDIVWEDEWRYFDDVFMHQKCVSEYLKNRRGMSKEQFLKLCGAQELRQAIQDTRQSFKDSMDFYTEKLDSLEAQLAEIEGRKSDGQMDMPKVR